MYYLPMLFIPLLSVFIAMSLGKPESFRLPRWTAFLCIPTAVFLLLVLTNDFHQLVFAFPADAPWPWEGVPVQPELSQQMVGHYTIVPEYIPFEEPQGVLQIWNMFVKNGDQVFHLLENKLNTYEYSDSGLKFVSSEELEDEYEYLSADSSGMLYLSPGIQTVIGIKDGQKAFQTTITGDLNMHSSGEWGISFWVNSDTQKITNQSENLISEPWILTGLNDDVSRKGPFSMLDDVEVTNSHIMAAGKIAAEDGNTKIIVYDYDGNQLLELGRTDFDDPDNLGAVTGMAETENGFVAIDGNMRQLPMAGGYAAFGRWLYFDFTDAET